MALVGCRHRKKATGHLRQNSTGKKKRFTINCKNIILRIRFSAKGKSQDVWDVCWQRLENAKPKFDKELDQRSCISEATQNTMKQE